MVPVSFIDACSTGEINDRQLALGVVIKRKANYKTGEARLTLEQIAALLCRRPTQTLRDDLRRLRPAWLAYESKPGQRDPYVIRLTGLADDKDAAPQPHGEPGPHGNLTGNDPVSREVDFAGREVGESPSPENKPALDPSEPLDREVIPVSTSTTSSEGDQALGKTTSEPEPPLPNEPEFPPLLDALEPDSFHKSPRLLRDEEIAQLGTASLDELRRRHERGEL
jgi:hypothetical protein